MTKKYTLTTSEETVTENPEDIIRLMKLAGLSNAQAVAEEEVNEDVYEPTEANDELDLDDYSKKSPESISKQKKSIQPSHGDNPLEYSLDENEIYEAMMKEFNEIEEGKLPPGLQAYQDKKNGKKDEAVEETVEETDEPIEEAKGYKIRDKSRGHGVADETYKSREEAKYAAVMKGASSGSEWEVIEESKPDFLDLDKDGDKEESMKKAAKDKKEKADESLDEATEDCADCEYMKDETDGEIDTCDECAAEERENANEEIVNEDESVWNQFKELHDKMDPESEDRIFFSMKNYPKHRFEIHGDIDGKDTKSGNVNVGVFLDQQTDNGDDFLQNMSISQDEIKANITGAGWVGADPDKGELKGTAGDYKEFGDVKPEPKDADMDRLRKLSGM